MVAEPCAPSRRAGASTKSALDSFTNRTIASRMLRTRGNPTLRRLDRLAGIPLVAAFGLAPKRARPPREALRRIGLLQTAAIGDTLLLSGPLRDLRRECPQAALVLITGTDNADVGPLLTIDEHVVVSTRAPFSAVRALRRARLHPLLDF